ncbi:uncharacterized protein LTR77_008722 [Saxophila tyrrhenica]|uniref:Uncharacterized protein n=1 Tax=Saxophila tyrrhenica TaxID=1690608 RepID=A0AAV9P3Y1_9PEZI|nr:hypothetical protein LTR77_008722 [Saxophila tyrrhenica]
MANGKEPDYSTSSRSRSPSPSRGLAWVDHRLRIVQQQRIQEEADEALRAEEQRVHERAQERDRVYRQVIQPVILRHLSETRVLEELDNAPPAERLEPGSPHAESSHAAMQRQPMETSGFQEQYDDAPPAELMQFGSPQAESSFATAQRQPVETTTAVSHWLFESSSPDVPSRPVQDSSSDSDEDEECAVRSSRSISPGRDGPPPPSSNQDRHMSSPLNTRHALNTRIDGSTPSSEYSLSSDSPPYIELPQDARQDALHAARQQLHRCPTAPPEEMANYRRTWA